MGCVNEPNEWDDKMLDETATGERYEPDAAIPEELPEVKEELERLDKEFDEKIQEVKDEFREVIDRNFEVGHERVVEPRGEIWEVDKFDKEGFAPLVREPPRPQAIFGTWKRREIASPKIEPDGRTLGETDLRRMEVRGYEPRSKDEIREKERQLRHGLEAELKNRATPEEKSIIRELEVAKDAEKAQREWIKAGRDVHEDAHMIKASPQVWTASLEASWKNYYEKCRETGKFVSDYAKKDADEFFAENYRMFFTNPDKVKTCHEEAYRSIDKIVTFLDMWEYSEETGQEG